MQCFVYSPVSRKTLCLYFEEVVTGEKVKEELHRREGICITDMCLYCNGKRTNDNEELRDGQVLQVMLPLIGGKGGFGSMLRAIGAQIEKTTNREACRDLSGRRLRDINEEKRLKNWIAKQAEREQEADYLKRKKLERLLSDHKHEFHDPTYDKQRSELTEKVFDAVEKGLQASTQATTSTETGMKRKNTKASGNILKKKCLWLGVDEAEVDSSDESSDSDSCKSPGRSTKQLEENSANQLTNQEESRMTDFEDTDRAKAILQGQTKNNCTENKSDQEDASDKTILGVNSHFKDREFKKPLDVTEFSPVKSDRSCSNSGQTYSDVQVSKPCSAPASLENCSSAEELENLGMDKLKAALMERGMKCGGTLQERAKRLFSIKGLPFDQINPSLLVKQNKK